MGHTYRACPHCHSRSDTPCTHEEKYSDRQRDHRGHHLDGEECLIMEEKETKRSRKHQWRSWRHAADTLLKKHGEIPPLPDGTKEHPLERKSRSRH